MFIFKENFSEEQKKTLSHFVSNVEGNVFVLKNLPEVVKGALFSRYSRSIFGLKTLLLKEFLSLDNIDLTNTFFEKDFSLQDCSLKKAQDFYQRVLDNFGDDSIGELGGAHVGVEYVSMLAAKILEDSRLGGSPLEKSTRYVYFDQKIKGQYLYYRDPILMTSAFKELFLKTCDHLFDVYSSLIPEIVSLFEKKYPMESNSSQSAYKASIRCKALDSLRGLLPAATLTNLGFFGNGRFWQNLIQKLQCHDLSEIKDLGHNCLEELNKVIPSFIVRANSHHKTQESFSLFWGSMKEQLKNVYRKQHFTKEIESSNEEVKLVYSNPEDIYKIAASLLYPYSHHSYEFLFNYCKKCSQEEILRIFESASSSRENRRHKSPRGLETMDFVFDILADFGVYRDLQRHRTLTQERQILTTNYGYSLSEELLDTPYEKIYRSALEEARQAHSLIEKEFPEEAQYVVPMAYNIRWFFHINLRALQWLVELRSQPQGHINYRRIAQKMALLVIEKHPLLEPFFKFVNYDDLSLGRLEQEEKANKKHCI